MGWRWASKGGFLHNELDDVRLEKTMETMKNSQKNRYFRPFLKEIFFWSTNPGRGGRGQRGHPKKEMEEEEEEKMPP